VKWVIFRKLPRDITGGVVTFWTVLLELRECDEGKMLFGKIACLDNKFWFWNSCFNL